MTNSNAQSVLTDSCDIQCPVCYLQHKIGPKSMRYRVLVANYVCPVLLMELLSCLHNFETSFDRCKPQLYTEVLLLSLDIFLTLILPASEKRKKKEKKKKKPRFIYGEGKLSVLWNILRLFSKVSFHQPPQYSTSFKLVSRKNNPLTRATSPNFVRERQTPCRVSCHVLQLLIHDFPGHIVVILPSHICLV